ncbi:MAG TPA: phosphotransferase [Acidimicrobiales bacterium]|nr:phosphotransferase [Acidimicrobiales bacterium]
MDRPDRGRRLAQGRDADIFEAGPGLVARRARDGRSIRREALIMQYVAAAGYPVPKVAGVSDDGSEILMERLEGPTMLDDLARHPWRYRRHADMLAELHRSLHVLPAPDWLPPAPGSVGDRLCHFDLHPLNVIMTRRGPVLVDWTNSCRGAGEADVALTWLLLACGGVPPVGRLAALAAGVRLRLAARFLSRFDPAPVNQELEAVGAWKCADRHTSEPERAAMRALVRANAA